MARLVRVTLFAVALAVSTSMASAEQARHAHAASRANFRAQQGDPYSSSQPSEVTTAAPYTTTAAPYSSQPAEVTTAAPYATTTAAPYSSQPAEVTTTAAPTYTTTAAPYSSQPAEVTTAAPTYTTAAPYSSQPAEVTTQAPYGSQPAEVTTQAPASSGSGCQWVYVDAQLVLSGASWANVQGNANAWSSLNGAITADVASLLGRSAADIAIQSITAANNALTVTFTARSNALAEAARIAALIRDDVPATAPLPAVNGVYTSVAGSSQDVSVASHTAASRDTYDCTGASSSQPSEITTPAPYGASQPSEVTAQAPAGAPTSYAPSTPSTPSGYAPSASSYPVYAALLLSGSGWQQIAASAWNALKAALASDIASALNLGTGSITINIMQATTTGLRVNYTVMTTSVQSAGEVTAETSQLDSALQLPATSVLYQQANPSTKNGTVSVSWAGSSSNFYTSPAGSLTAWMPLLASAAAVAAVAALVH